MKAAVRRLASHTPKLPLILPLKPPAPPSPPPSSSGSSRSSTPRAAASRGSSAGSASFSASPSSSSSPSSLLPQPRPDYARILHDPSYTTSNHLSRRSGLSPDHVAHISRLRETQLLLLQKLQNIRAKQNEISNMIKNRLGDTEELVRQAKKLKARVGDYEGNLKGTEGELVDMCLELPNWTHPEVPLGEERNARLREVTGPPMENAEVDAPAGKPDPMRDHLRVAAHWDLLDNEASTIASGSSWPYMKGVAALLELALINYAVSVAIRHGYTPVIPPDVIKSDIASRCGFNPRDSGGAQQTYTLSPTSSSSDPSPASPVAASNDPTHCLAGTAEIPLSALFANRVLPLSSLPAKVVGVGHAFRAEAGARGSDTRGLYRVHQFTKVELFSVTSQDGSDEEMGRMGEVQKDIVRELGLSARVLEMPSEELGASANRKWDMEAWMPGRGKWGEISSLSNCTDYQARRLHIRYRPPTTPPPPGPDLANSPPNTAQLVFAHTLNGTAAAVPRLILALLENGVELGPEGEVLGLKLPGVLRRFWVGGDEVGSGKNKGVITWS